MFEFAISDGEGTLIDYGVVTWLELLAILRAAPYTCTHICGPALPGCQTGQ